MERFDLDKLLASFGWGKFQIRTYIPLFGVVIFSVFQMSFIFTARDTKYRCKIDSCEDDNLSVYNPDWLRNAVPYKDNIPDRCLYYHPVSNKTCIEFYRNVTYTCDSYIFEKNQTTIVQDFSITCDENLWKLTIVGTVNVLGELFCHPFAGYVSDRFGRKRMLVFSMIFTTAIGLTRSFSGSYSSYLTLEFLDTVLGSGAYSGAFVLALEIVDTRRRGLANTIICLAFATGQVILGLVAWLTPSWRIFLRIIYSSGIFITLSLWYIPESVRWLLSKNRNDEAFDVLNKLSKLNSGRDLKQNTLTAIQLEVDDAENKNKSIPYREILKSKTLVLRIIHCSFTWICCNFPYYGLTIQSVSLSEDVYINFICTALIEVPAYIITQGVMDRIGRRKTLGFSLILGGFSCVFVYLIASPKWLALMIFLSGKFFITVAYTTLYIYTAEMFPTNSRHSVLAICSMFGRIGSMLAPQVPLLEQLFRSLPLIIFSAMSVTSGIFAFWFPETLDLDLPDEINQAIDIE